MKNLAKLTLYFTLTFAALFVAAIGLWLLFSWIELIRFFPLGDRPGEAFAEMVWKAFPAAIYLSVLLTLSYTARRNMPIPLAITGIFILGCVFSLGVPLGISRTGALNPVIKPVSSLEGRPGLILSRSDNAMILLKGNSDVRGPRVVSLPGRSLIYQEVPLGPNNTILNLPALAFVDDTPWFIRSVGIDFFLSAGELKGRLEDGFFPFAVYAFSLVLLLASLRFLLELSHWPLANLFLGALAFRGILALETFLNAREMNVLIDSFLNGRLPSMLITPAVFSALAVLILLYTLLVRIARPGRQDD